METKSLVEELRDIADDRHYGAGCRLRSEFCSKPCDDYIACHDCTGEALRTIADRIEREYMPLPMLEGEPLKVGDRVDGYTQKGAEVVAVMNSDMVVVRSTVKGGYGYHDEAYPLLLWSIDELKRPEPEVLDADGVPIHVGDTVWTVYSGEKEKVVGILPGKRIAIESGGWRRNVVLSHKQPDTLERIEEDAMKAYDEYWGCRHVSCHDCPAMADGKKPYERYATGYSCVLAKTFDLLRRQREVLERGHE